MSKNIRVLSAEDVKRTLTMNEAIQAMADGFRQLYDGSAGVPLRTRLNIPGHNADALFMPVYLPETNMFAIKTVSIFNDNIQRDLPVIQAMVSVFDAQDGRPLALIDGESMTAIRTGAASGLATRLLAPSDAHIATLFGAGPQGRTQLEAITSVRKLDKIYVIDKDTNRADAFIDSLQTSINVSLAATSDRSVIAESQIICCATPSTEPVFSDKDLQPGTHINAVGSFKPDMQELPSESVKRAKVVVDSREGCLAETGDLLIPIGQGIISEDHILAELGELVVTDKIIRKRDYDITLFKSVGNAVQDLAAAAVILKNSKEMNIGEEVNI